VTRPAPGPDQIVLAAADGRALCYERQHQAAGQLADVLVVFGQLGTLYVDALWQECWGRTLPMCGDCWQITCTVATARRPHLTVHDTRPQRRHRTQTVTGDRPA
jgi:hypothetical protein